MWPAASNSIKLLIITSVSIEDVGGEQALQVPHETLTAGVSAYVSMTSLRSIKSAGDVVANRVNPEVYNRVLDRTERVAERRGGQENEERWLSRNQSRRPTSERLISRQFPGHPQRSTAGEGETGRGKSLAALHGMGVPDRHYAREILPTLFSQKTLLDS